MLLTLSKLSFLPQLVRYSSEGVLQLGPLGSTAFLPDSKCLVDDGKGRTPTLKKCEDVLRPAQRFWDFTQVWKSSGNLEEINWRGMMLQRVFNEEQGGLGRAVLGIPPQCFLETVRYDFHRSCATKGYSSIIARSFGECFLGIFTYPVLEYSQFQS